MQTTKSGRMVKWGPIETGQSFNFYFQATKGSKEQITLKDERVGDYYCFPIVVEGDDTVKMLPLHEQYNAELIKVIEESRVTETTLCKLSKVAYKKKDGTQGGKLQFEILSGPRVSTSDDLPPLEDYLNGTQGDQSTNSTNPSAINANKTQAPKLAHKEVQKQDPQNIAWAIKTAVQWCGAGDGCTMVSEDVLKDYARRLIQMHQELMSE